MDISSARNRKINELNTAFKAETYKEIEFTLDDSSTYTIIGQGRNTAIDFMIAKTALDSDPSLTHAGFWGPTGQRQTLSKADYIELFEKICIWATAEEQKHADLLVQVMSATTEEEIDAITW